MVTKGKTMPKVRSMDPIGEMITSLCGELYGAAGVKLDAEAVGKAVGCTAATIRNDRKKQGSIPLARLCALAHLRGYEIKAVKKGE